LLKVLIDVPRYETLLQVDFASVPWSKGQEFGLAAFSGAPSEDQQRLRDLIQATEAASALKQENIQR